MASYATAYGGGAVARLTVQRDGSALGPFVASAAFMRLRGHRDAAVTSWATVDRVPDASRFTVYQSGPRRLWDEVEAAYAWWESEGFPGYGRLGLTVDPDTGAHTPWLDGPDHPLPAPAQS